MARARSSPAIAETLVWPPPYCRALSTGVSPRPMRPLCTEARANVLRRRPSRSHGAGFAVLLPAGGSGHARHPRDTLRSPEHPPWVGSATKTAALKYFRDVDRIRDGERQTISAERDVALHERPPFVFAGSLGRAAPALHAEIACRLLETDHLIDGPLKQRLADGDIRLLRLDWLLDGGASDGHLARCAATGAPVMRHHQMLPPKAFFSPHAALRLLARRDRSIFALTPAWASPRHPDPHGATLAAVRAHLAREAGATSSALFWAFACVPQPPYDLRADETSARAACHAWGAIFGSFTATCVLRCGGSPYDYEALRERPYAQRAWPRFEQLAATLSAAALEAAAARAGVLPERLALAAATRPKMVDLLDAAPDGRPRRWRVSRASRRTARTFAPSSARRPSAAAATIRCCAR